MSWIVFIIFMVASMLISGFIAKLLTRGPAVPPAEPLPQATLPPPDSAPAGWGDEPASPRAGRKRGTLAMQAVGGAAAAAADGGDDDEPQRGRRRSTMQGAAATGCPRHPDKKVEWTCRFCKTDYCRDCRLKIDTVVCCPQRECRERAERFAAARRSRG